jgi:20S proteasome alpha/beta subunit
LPSDYSNISGITIPFSIPTSFPVIPFYRYLEQLQEIVNKYKQEAKRSGENYSFDVLVAAEVHFSGLHLSYIDVHGTTGDVTDYKVIGQGENIALYF